MRRALAGLFLLWSSLIAASAQAESKWLDQSTDIFLTPKLNTLASSFRDFPLFWWNFVVVEGEIAGPELESLCSTIASRDADVIRKIPCHMEMKDLRLLTQDWVRDVYLREPFPGEAKFKAALDETLNKASLPMGRSLIEVLRADPMNTLSDLKERIEKRTAMDLPLKNGFLIDEKQHHVLIPLQFNFSPKDSGRTSRFLEHLNTYCAGIKGCTHLGLFGPHAGSAENELRIREDVGVVSVVGTAALALLCLFILLTGRHRILNLVPILFFSIGTTACLTILLFGKIHGITLAFGPGIVGLAMDYGIHSCFLGPRDKKTWTANWIGIWTTISIMIVLGFSAIPLLRQMMFFSIFGLCFSYFLFWLILRRWPQYFEAEHYRFTPSRWAVLVPVSWVLLASVPLMALQKVHLDIQHLNYESAKTAEVREWFGKSATSLSPYFLVEDKDPLALSHEFESWSRGKGIAYEGVANYLPASPLQSANVQGWRDALCAKQMTLSEAQAKFFAPFFESLACDKLNVRDLSRAIPDYLADFHYNGRFVSLFFPKTEAEIEAVKTLPGVSTPRTVFESFPRIFSAELWWMVPIAFAASFFFLLLHYRNFGASLLAVVPFLTGLGLFALMALVLKLPVSFISLIGLLMVFGCSLDYGVFVMDFLLFRDGDKPGVWSALSLCAFATMAGFAPLVFAKHPVLNDLGQALLWGTLGTYIGSLWAIPSVYSLAKKWKAGT